MKPITVVIADDHPIVLLGVSELIKRDDRFLVVGEASSPSQLIQELNSKKPDVLISDYSMPGDSIYGDGLKLMEYLVRNYPFLKILVLTMVSNSSIFSRLYDLGVAGVVEKNQLHAEIQHALDALIHRRKYKCLASNKNQSGSEGSQIEERLALLSLRELEVLRLFYFGKSLRDIADDHHRSPKTISTQKVAAMRKLGVKTDQELMAFCRDANLFQ
ncbi:response regulator [Pseudomonas sp. GZD-222]|uniref:response regulator n=1 Tax=Pseudomonas sp. GZD-222 TaxID=3404805 RepID=UPI003BB4D887